MSNSSDFEKFKDLYIKKEAIKLTEDEDQKFVFLKKFLMRYSELFFLFIKNNEESLKKIDKKFGRKPFHDLSKDDQLLLKKISFLYSGFNNLIKINENRDEFSVNRDGFSLFYKDSRPIEEQKVIEKRFDFLAEENNIEGYNEVNM